MRRRLPLLLLLVLGLAACGGDDERSRAGSGALSPAELGWIREYSVWTIDVWDEELGHEPGPTLVRECRSRLAEVGLPPTARLEPAAERAHDVCPWLERRGSTRRALDVIEDSDALIIPLLLDSRTLPLREGRTTHSRADVRLSAAASERAEEAIEVRCWSGPEWRRLVRERNAWRDASDNPEELLGFGQLDDARIHMRLDQCNTLARLRQDDVLDWARERQIDAADALVTFAHETQHFILDDAEEHEVECAAAEAASSVAREVGASNEESERLEELYRTELYPELSDEYRGDGCD